MLGPLGLLFIASLRHFFTQLFIIKCTCSSWKLLSKYGYIIHTFQGHVFATVYTKHMLSTGKEHTIWAAIGIHAQDKGLLN